MLLRQRSYDVVAVSDRADLVGRSDMTILETASSELRAVVTNNIKDFRPLAAEGLARGQSHGGVVLPPSQIPTLNSASPRSGCCCLGGD